jgi:hypothetical protein
MLCEETNMISSLEDAKPFLMSWYKSKSVLTVFFSASGLTMNFACIIEALEADSMRLGGNEVTAIIEFERIQTVEFQIKSESASEYDREIAARTKLDHAWHFTIGEARVAIIGPESSVGPES